MNELEEVQSYLESQNTIRLFIDASPYFGYQYAGLKTLQRLRDLGFRGTFEVIYFEEPTFGSNAAKLNRLIPDFDTRLSDQTISSLNARFISHTKWASEPSTQVELGMTGGMDGDGAEDVRTLLKTQYFIRLTPMGWSFPSLNNIVGPNRATMPLPRLAYHLPIRISIPPIDDIDTFLNEALMARPNLEAKRKGLSALLKTQAQTLVYQRVRDIQQFELVYSALASAMIDRADLFPKGCVIVVLYDSSAKVLHDSIPLNTFIPKEVFLDVESLESNSSFSAKWEQNTRMPHVVIVGDIPMDVYEQIVSTATMPIFARGANTMELAWNLHKQFVVTDGTHPDVLDDDLPMPIYAILNQASSALTNHHEINYDPVKSYLLEAMDPASSLSQFYASYFQSHFSQTTPDKIQVAIGTLIRFKRGSNSQPCK